MSAIRSFRFSLVLAVSAFMALPAIAQTAAADNESERPLVVSTTGPEADPGTGSQDDPDDPEGDQIVNYYTNYLSEYRLGPQDIVSVEVFGQCPDYCRQDVMVPPTARMSYPLLREGVFVGGRTVEEVADEITKRLEEFIINPKVTVTLMRPGSARYAVMGKVGAPGVRVMERRISINEAIYEAGGLAKGASRNKIYLARFSSKGFMTKERVNLVAIEKGKEPTIFLKPGDQVIVGAKTFSWDKIWGAIGQASAARILFGSPF